MQCFASCGSGDRFGGGWNRAGLGGDCAATARATLGDRSRLWLDRYGSGSRTGCRAGAGSGTSLFGDARAKVIQVRSVFEVERLQVVAARITRGAAGGTLRRLGTIGRHEENPGKNTDTRTLAQGHSHSGSRCDYHDLRHFQSGRDRVLHRVEHESVEQRRKQQTRQVVRMVDKRNSGSVRKGCERLSFVPNRVRTRPVLRKV